MSIINNMPSKGNMTINGLIEEYYIWVGEEISIGSFITFIDSIAASTLNSNEKSGYAISPVLKLSEDKVFIAHYDSTNLYLQVSICSVKETGISVIATKILTNFAVNNYTQSVLLSNGDIMVLYSTSSGTDIYGVICRFTNNTIITGDSHLIYTVSDYAGDKMAAVCPSSMQVLLHCWRSSDAGYYILIKAENFIITTVKQGSSGTYAYGMSMTLLNDGRIFSEYGTDSDYKKISGRIITVTDSGYTLGASTVVMGTDLIGYSAYPGYYDPALAVLANGNIFISYRTTNTFGYMGCAIITVSGDTLSCESTSTFLSQHTYYSITNTLLPTDQVAVFCYNDENTSSIYGRVFTISGTSITGSTACALQCLTSFKNTGSRKPLRSMLLNSGTLLLFYGNDTTYTLTGQKIIFDSSSSLLMTTNYPRQVANVSDENCNGLAKTGGGAITVDNQGIIEVYVPNI